MQMPGRSYNSSSYRYGAANGQEKSTELNENLYTAEYWEYDSRIGRRWNLDVVEKAWISGYATYGNNPIMFVDPDGADWYKDKKGGTYHWEDRTGHGGKVSFWTARNKKDISTWYGANKDDVQMDGGYLQTVVVTSSHPGKAAPVNWFHIPDYTPAEVAISRNNYYNFKKGNFSGLSPDQIKLYSQWQQADKDWRTMSYIFVGGMAAPLAAVGLAETGAADLAWQGGKWLFQQGVNEGGLIKEGAKWLGRKYGRSFLTEVGINYFQNGMDIRKIDAFDIFTNTLNPFRSSLKGRVLMGGANSLVDVNLFAGQGQHVSYLGNGKNFGQVSLDFSFGLFNEGMKYTFGTLGGGDANREFVLDILTGNGGGQAQQAAADKK